MLSTVEYAIHYRWLRKAVGHTPSLKDKIRINHQIKASELRVIGPEGENFGVLSLSEALQKALDFELDLIEISPNTIPPIGKIADYGKFKYEESKKEKQAKAKQKIVELKTIQISVGTGENDLNLKAKKATEWLKEGHRIKVDLTLKGRTKYMDINFLKERMDRLFRLIAEEYVLAGKVQKGPRGLSAILEKTHK